MYAEDLQAVQLELMRAHATKGESLVAAVRHPRQRLVIAEQTLNSLRRRAPLARIDTAPSTEASTLVQAWEAIYQSAANALSDEAAERRREDLVAHHQHKRSLFRGAAGLALLVISLLGILFAWPKDSDAGARITPAALEQSLRELQSHQPQSNDLALKAEELLRILREPHGGSSGTAEAWLPRFAQGLISYDQGLAELPDSMQERWREWGRNIHRAGIESIGTEVEEPAMDAFFEQTRKLTIGLGYR